MMITSRNIFVHSININGTSTVVIILVLSVMHFFVKPRRKACSKIPLSHTLHPSLWTQSNKKSTILKKETIVGEMMFNPEHHADSDEDNDASIEKQDPGFGSKAELQALCSLLLMQL
jgi:hypothetical protein